MTDDELKDLIDQIRIDIHAPQELLDQLPPHLLAFATDLALAAVAGKIWEQFRPAREPYKPKSLR